MTAERCPSRIAPELKHTAWMFVATRLALIAVGVCAWMLLPRERTMPNDWVYSGHPSLDMWIRWDSVWYLRIAHDGYPAGPTEGQSSYGFFPLYPLLIKAVHGLGSSRQVSALLVSNVALCVACFFLYRLARLSFDEPCARRSIKYLFLFPSAFILSGAFSESVFLALSVMSFYYARRERWLFCGAAGFLGALTRSNGVFLLLPLAYEYLRSKGFTWRRLRADALSLSLIPLGTFAFMGYCYLQTGDAMAYVHAKQTGFHLVLSNPIKVLLSCLQSHSIPLLFNVAFGLIVLLFLTVFVRRIGFAYWLLGVITILLCLAYGMGDSTAMYWALVHPRGITSLHGMTRFSLGIFPLYLLLAQLSSNETVDRCLTVFLALLQGALLVLWIAGTTLVV